MFLFFFQAEDGIRDVAVTGVQTCALPISNFLVRIFRAPVGMIHHKRARLAQNLVPDDERRTDGEPAVSRCWLNVNRSEEHTSELQSRLHLVCRLLLEKKKMHKRNSTVKLTRRNDA